MIVLDCSVVFGFAFKEERNEYNLSALKSLESSKALVPQIFSVELVNVLIVQERRKRWTKKQSEEFIALLSNLPIIIDDTLSLKQAGNILNFARDYSLSSYDALYLATAVKYEVPLATQNTALKKAAIKAGVFFE